MTDPRAYAAGIVSEDVVRRLEQHGLAVVDLEELDKARDYIQTLERHIASMWVTLRTLLRLSNPALDKVTEPALETVDELMGFGPDNLCPGHTPPDITRDGSVCPSPSSVSGGECAEATGETKTDDWERFQTKPGLASTCSTTCGDVNADACGGGGEDASPPPRRPLGDIAAEIEKDRTQKERRLGVTDINQSDLTQAWEEIETEALRRHLSPLTSPIGWAWFVRRQGEDKGFEIPKLDSLILNELLKEEDYCEAAAKGAKRRACASGAQLIADERQRQVTREGFLANDDQQYSRGELALAAACYAVEQTDGFVVLSDFNDAWPWSSYWDKRRKHSRERRLIIAGALIAAEIDRLRATSEGAAK